MKSKLIEQLLNLNPEEGHPIRVPPLKEEGAWVGAPSITYDTAEGKYYLYYRLRHPRSSVMRNVNYHRGYEARIAESFDGVFFSDIWALSKREANVRSFERGCLRKVDDEYRLYLSYDDAKDHTWKIALLESEDPSNFSFRDAKVILTPNYNGKNVDHVKDPYLVRSNEQWLLFANYHDKAVSKVSETGIAVSEDGINFKWLGDLFPQDRSGWDAEIARLTSVIGTSDETIMCYDCGESMEQRVCEEKTGVGIIDLSKRKVKRIEDERLPLSSPHGSGSLRYVDAVKGKGALKLFYEYATKWNTHELRMSEFSIQ